MDAIQFDTERYLVDVDRPNGRDAGGGLFEALLRDDQARYEHLPEQAARRPDSAADWHDNQRALVEAQRQHAEAYRKHRDDERRLKSDRDDAAADGRPYLDSRDDAEPEPESVATGTPQAVEADRGPHDDTVSTDDDGALAEHAPPAAVAEAATKPDSGDTRSANGSEGATAPVADQASTAQANGIKSEEPQATTATAAADTTVEPTVAPVAGVSTTANQTEVAADPVAAVITGQSAQAPAGKPTQESGRPAAAASDKASDKSKVEAAKPDTQHKPAAQETGNSPGARVTVTTPGLTSQPGANLAATATMAALSAEGEAGGRAQAATALNNAQARHADTNSGLEKALAAAAKNGAKGDGNSNNAAQDKSNGGNKALTQQAASTNNASGPAKVTATFEPLQPSTPVAGDLGNSVMPGNAASTVFGAAATVTTPQGVAATAAGIEAQARAHAAAANPSDQVAVQIQKGLAAGKDKISIKLSPAELGRIDIKMELADDGRLRAVIAAERPETLEMLQRDSRALERALQEAGVKTDSGSLSFSNRGSRQQGEFANGSDGLMTTVGGNGDGGGEVVDPAALAAQRMSQHDGALDISV